MKPITVRELYKQCEIQMRLGNGDKVIMISSDDEGNGYHYLWYSFTSMEEMEKPLTIGSKVVPMKFEYSDERVAKKEDTIILG